MVSPYGSSDARIPQLAPSAEAGGRHGHVGVTGEPAPPRAGAGHVGPAAYTFLCSGHHGNLCSEAHTFHLNLFFFSRCLQGVAEAECMRANALSILVALSVSENARLGSGSPVFKYPFFSLIFLEIFIQRKRTCDSATN